MSDFPNIHIDVESNNDGTYNAYIDTENSSGESYEKVNAAKIGEHVADLIDTLEESHSGNSYLKTKYELVFTDGYTIQRSIYDSKELAQKAMEDDYKSYNHNEPGDEWDEMSDLSRETAILYDCGHNVYVWHIFACTTA